MDDLIFFVNTFVKFFFLFTPFFALTMFLTMTEGMDEKARRRLAVKIIVSVSAACFLLFILGREIFAVFGITIDAFRIGAGSLLFISAVTLVNSKSQSVRQGSDDDIAVVPLAIPIIVGPATIGAILIMGVEVDDISQRFAGLAALFCAILATGIILILASYLEKLIGKKGLSILTKITGLVLSALAAQLVFTGIKNFLK